MVHEFFILDVAPGGWATSHEGKVLHGFLKHHCFHSSSRLGLLYQKILHEKQSWW